MYIPYGAFLKIINQAASFGFQKNDKLDKKHWITLLFNFWDMNQCYNNVYIQILDMHYMYHTAQETCPRVVFCCVWLYLDTGQFYHVLLIATLAPGQTLCTIANGATMKSAGS